MKIKKYECKKCGKKYCYLGWALRHSAKKRHSKFKDIAGNKFKFKDEN